MSAIAGRRALPGPAVWALAVAVVVLWIGVLLGLVGLLLGARSGLPLPSLTSIAGRFGDSAMANAVLMQWGFSALTMLCILVLGSISVMAHLLGNLERAADVAIWLVRALMVVTVVGPMVAIGPILAVNGVSFSALAALAPSLPQMLVSLAFLVCAAAYLKRGPADVFG